MHVPMHALRSPWVRDQLAAAEPGMMTSLKGNAWWYSVDALLSHGRAPHPHLSGHQRPSCEVRRPLQVVVNKSVSMVEYPNFGAV